MEHKLKKGPKRLDLPLFLKMTMPRSEWAGDLSGLLPSLVSYNQREEDRKNCTLETELGTGKDLVND